MFGLPEALMSFIRRQVGLRTDAANAAGSLHAKIAHLTGNAIKKHLTPSDTLRYSADTERSTESTSYVKLKEVYVANQGKIRVSFEAISTPSVTGYAQIYVNGVARGTERTFTYLSWNTFVEDIWVESGGLVQLYCKGGTSVPSRVRNFRIYWDYSTEDGAVLVD